MLQNNVGRLTAEIRASSKINLQEKAVDASEELQKIEADKGYDALKSVTVNAAKLQKKSATIEENQQDIIADEEFYGLKSVTIPALKLQEKEVDASEENQEITADNEYTALKRVIVKSAKLQDKIAVPSAVAATKVVADDSYYGLKSVTVEQVKLENITANASEEEQVLRASENNDAIESVTINAAKLQEKIVDKLRSHEQKVVADDSYYGLKSVTVPALLLQSKSVDVKFGEATKEIHADPGYNALSSVTLNSPTIPEHYFDTSDATATASDIAKDKVAYTKNGRSVGTGTVEENSAIAIMTDTITKIILEDAEISFSVATCGSIHNLALVDAKNCDIKTWLLFQNSQSKIKKMRLRELRTDIRTRYTALDELNVFSFYNTAYPEQLSILVIRDNSVVYTLSQASYISDTLTIYVDDSLVDQYKSATNWSVHESQIKPISEYAGWSNEV